MHKWKHMLAITLALIALTIPLPTMADAGSTHAKVQHTLTAAEMDLLARVVSAEARGEPYEGQVAVAAVVLNRMHSKPFPNTVSGVVYQKYQFESVLIGATREKAVPSAVKATQDALRGWDPTNGALYFFNPAKTKNKFLWSRPVAKMIGQHRFTY